MANQIDRTGHFRAVITEYGLNEYESGAVAVAIKARITDQWNGESKEWESWEQYEEVEAAGFLNVVKKDGKLNKAQVESLIKYCNWNGELSSIAERTWEPCACQISIGCEVYKDQKQYRINFVNDYSRTPGEVGNVDSEKAKALDSRFGGEMRAIFGTVKQRNAPPAGNRPKSPPKKEAVEAGANSEPKGDLPF